ncbi:DUF1376 domain-containing protein [bacterium]|nr:DUF1376 domain-containing protein [bacterium]
MHYYQHNIADYRKDTIHLSLLEHGVYRQLLDQYYLSQQPLPIENQKIYRLINARSDDEKQAIENVLNDFFDKTEVGYVHKRCDIEIETYQAKSDRATQSAKARWDKPVKNMRTHSERIANAVLTHKPINSLTNNILTIGDSDFDIFWKEYPKKVGKDTARKAWNKTKPNLDVVLKALSWQKQSEQWFKSNGQFIPNPSTWINQGRWEDEPPERVAF